VVTGDLAHDGEPAAYEWLGARLAALGVPVHCLPGNHDATDAMGAHLPRDGVTLPDALDLDGWRFLFLDTNAHGREIGPDGTVRDRPDRTHVAHTGGLLPEDARWLDVQLASAGDQPVMVWMHHPVVAHPLAEAVERAGDAPALRERFVQAGCVRAVSAGHLHHAFATERDGVQHFTCPSLWLDLDFDARTMMPPGYRHFRFAPDGTVESTAHFVDDPRYAERPPFPDWVLKVLTGMG
jgi:Icc protein